MARISSGILSVGSGPEYATTSIEVSAELPALLLKLLPPHFRLERRLDPLKSSENAVNVPATHLIDCAILLSPAGASADEANRTSALSPVATVGALLLLLEAEVPASSAAASSAAIAFVEFAPILNGG